MCLLPALSLLLPAAISPLIPSAGQYNASGCNAQYPSCSYQVGYNGSSYNQSYWAINDLRVFATGGGTDNAANSANTDSSKTSGARSKFSAVFANVLPVQLAAILIASLAIFASTIVA
jgi:hypothetical protein